jgi:Sigma-70 region 2
MGNERQQFEELFLPFLDAAYNLARWIIRNEHDAEDIVQEAYLRAFKGFRGFRGDNAKAWLLTIVRNTYTWLSNRGLNENLVPYASALGVAIGTVMSRLSRARCWSRISSTVFPVISIPCVNWFNGKLDYSPPVPELSQAGYALKGGRIDLLDRRAVAAIVYEHGKHVINLFVWPPPGNQDSGGLAAIAEDGFCRYLMHCLRSKIDRRTTLQRVVS